MPESTVSTSANGSLVPPQWTAGRVFLATLVVVGVALGFLLLYLFYEVLFLLFIGVVLATALKPLVNWVQQSGMSRSSAVVVVYAVLGTALLIGSLVALPFLFEQLAKMTEMIPETYRQLREQLLEAPSAFVRRLAARLPESLTAAIGAPPGADSLDAVAQAINYSTLALNTLFSCLAVLLFAFYWSLQETRTIQMLLLIVPPDDRDEARELSEAIQARVGGYIRGQFLLCAVIGAVSFVAYWLIGLPYAVPLALLAGIFEAVPMIGPILSVVPAGLVALSIGPTTLLYVLGAALAIQQLENHLLVPRVMNQAVGVRPLITLLAIAAFGSLFGILGAILAIPLAAVLQLLVKEFVLNEEALEPVEPEGRDYVSLLRYQARELIHDVRRQVRRKEAVTAPANDRIEELIELVARELDKNLAEEAANKQPRTEGVA